jgi:phosphoribosylamine--glycine ligase
MKIFFISSAGCSLDLAMKVKDEGHDETLYIKYKESQDIGHGLVNRTNTLNGMSDADLVVIDDVGFGAIADNLRAEGKAVIGGSKITDKLENDRMYGHDIMKAVGIIVPKATGFKDFKSARELIKQTDKRYVFKSNGQKDKFLTHVATDSEEMLAMMDHFEKSWEGEPNFELQEFVDGIEVAVSGWFDGEKFIPPIFPNFEHKKLMEGDKGPNTYEMGTVLIGTPFNKLYHETLGRIEPFLKTSGYVGSFDLNCIATSSAIYGLEFTSRFGDPTIQIQSDLHFGPWGNFFKKLVDKKVNIVPAMMDKWAVGVAICTLPYPMENNSKQFKDLPLFIYNEEDITDTIHLHSVYKKGKQYLQGGDNGYIMICTSNGKTIEKAQAKVYEIVEDSVYVPSEMWRSDIGDRVLEDYPKLEEWGWFA